MSSVESGIVVADEIDDVVSPETRSSTSTIPVIPIENIVVNFFAAEGFLTRLFRAREKVLTQAREGKRSYFTFDYPGVGWVQYDHNSIDGIFRLAAAKSGPQLAEIHLNERLPRKIRLHAIAALLIQREDHIMKLYNGARRARNSNYKPKTIVVFFQHPFQDIFRSNKNTIMLNGKELIQYQDYGHHLRFQPFIPSPVQVPRASSSFITDPVNMHALQESHMVTRRLSADVDADSHEMTTEIGM